MGSYAGLANQKDILILLILFCCVDENAGDQSILAFTTSTLGLLLYRLFY